MNQLMAKVSSGPNVRQLTAFRTERLCVSVPSNDGIKRGASSLGHN
jgi:hypothetical protein